MDLNQAIPYRTCRQTLQSRDVVHPSILTRTIQEKPHAIPYHAVRTQLTPLLLLTAFPQAYHMRYLVREMKREKDKNLEMFYIFTYKGK